MKNRIIGMAAAVCLLNASASAQDVMDKIAKESCGCIVQVDMTDSEEGRNMQLGLCMLQGAMPYKKELKKKYGIDVDNIDKDGERFGQMLGVRLAVQCPEFVALMARMNNKVASQDRKSTPESTHSGSDNVVIPLRKSGGVYCVEISVNGQVLKDVVFDSGASTVSISATEALFLLKQGYLSESDFIGTQSFQTADGSIREGSIVNIRKLKIGSVTLDNVEATVTYNLSAPILLGQSALERFGRVSIDYDKQVLILSR